MRGPAAHKYRTDFFTFLTEKICSRLLESESHGRNFPDKNLLFGRVALNPGIAETEFLLPFPPHCGIALEFSSRMDGLQTIRNCRIAAYARNSAGRAITSGIQPFDISCNLVQVQQVPPGWIHLGIIESHIPGRLVRLGVDVQIDIPFCCFKRTHEPFAVPGKSISCQELYPGHHWSRIASGLTYFPSGEREFFQPGI